MATWNCKHVIEVALESAHNALVDFIEAPCEPGKGFEKLVELERAFAFTRRLGREWERDYRYKNR